MAYEMACQAFSEKSVGIRIVFMEIPGLIHLKDTHRARAVL